MKPRKRGFCVKGIFLERRLFMKCQEGVKLLQKYLIINKQTSKKNYYGKSTLFNRSYLGNHLGN